MRAIVRSLPFLAALAATVSLPPAGAATENAPIAFAIPAHGDVGQFFSVANDPGAGTIAVAVGGGLLGNRSILDIRLAKSGRDVRAVDTTCGGITTQTSVHDVPDARAYLVTCEGDRQHVAAFDASTGRLLARIDRALNPEGRFAIESAGGVAFLATTRPDRSGACSGNETLAVDARTLRTLGRFEGFVGTSSGSRFVRECDTANGEDAFLADTRDLVAHRPMRMTRLPQGSTDRWIPPMLVPWSEERIAGDAEHCTLSSASGRAEQKFVCGTIEFDTVRHAFVIWKTDEHDHTHIARYDANGALSGAYDVPADFGSTPAVSVVDGIEIVTADRRIRVLDPSGTRAIREITIPEPNAVYEVLPLAGLHAVAVIGDEDVFVLPLDPWQGPMIRAKLPAAPAK